jgi:hypothetical protein
MLRVNLPISRLRQSRRAIAIPTTFLILLVTMLGIVSITYYFSIEKVKAQSQTLKVVSARQDMESLDEATMSVLWEPGSSRRVEFTNSGEELTVQPLTNFMKITITGEGDLSDVIFNETIGQISCTLPFSVSALDTGTFLKGDSRTIIQQSGPGITQLRASQGVNCPELQLRYRPIVSYSSREVEGNLPINNLRVYIVTLNSSQEITMMGALSLKVMCVTAQVTTKTYNLTQANERIFLTCEIGEENGQVSVPIQSTVNGAIVQVEIVQCRVEIDQVVR